MSQNNKNNKPGKNSNLRGMLSLVAWALLLTVVFTYAGAYIEQDMDDATQREIAYSEFTTYSLHVTKMVLFPNVQKALTTVSQST